MVLYEEEINGGTYHTRLTNPGKKILQFLDFSVFLFDFSLLFTNITLQHVDESLLTIV